MKKTFRILKFKKDKPIFEVVNVSKSFEGRPVLKKLSIKVYPGECVGILGPNKDTSSPGKTFIEIFFNIDLPLKDLLTSFTSKIGLSFLNLSILKLFFINFNICFYIILIR